MTGGTEDLPLLEAAFVQAPIGSGIVDARGVVLRVNPSLCELVGRAEHELLGRRYLELVSHPDDVDRERANFKRLVRREVMTCEEETRRVRPDGTVIWVHSWASVALDAAGRPLGAGPSGRPRYIIRRLVDVTRQRELTAALEEARRQAVAADQAKTDFLARVSHELRTPLTAVLGFAELLEGDYLPAQHAKELGHIVVAGRHLLGLVDDLLDLSRIEEGRLTLTLEPVNVAGVLMEAAGLIQSQAETAQIAVIPRLPRAKDSAMLADRRRLVEILLNLLTNAVKFCPPGSEVRVSAGVSRTQATMTVTDTGPGLTDEEQSRLFVPFERLDADQRGIPGSGLGLAVSRRLAEAMGGTLRVASEPDRGAAFTVSLPRSHAFPAASQVAAAAPDAHHDRLVGRPWSVLYVEDNPVNARLVDAVLTRFTDAELTVITTGEEAVEGAIAHPPDLVLLDLGLPDLPGAEVLARLRAAPATAKVPVVVLTADISPGRREELMRAGAQALLGKPLAVHALLDTLADLLAQAPPVAR